MKIGIDMTFIRPDHKNGGTESALKNLIKGIEAVRAEAPYQDMEFLYFIYKDVYPEYKKQFSNLQYCVYDMKGSHAFRMVFFQSFILPGLVKKKQLDLLYFPTFQTGLKLKWPVKLVVNPHDIQFRYYPEYFSKLKRIYYYIFYGLALKKADAVITISDYVEKCYQTHFPKETKGKMHQIYDAIDFDAIPEIKPNSIAGFDGDYILCINSLLKHKNTITLIKAFHLLNRSDMKLVLAGAVTDDANILVDYIRENRMEDSVILTGRVDDGELQYLYHHAKLFVTPSLYEGFGMTPIEAMAAKCPVISSKETSLYEVTQGLVFYYEPAADEHRLKEKIQEILEKIDAGDITEEYTEKLRQTVYDSYDKKRIAKEFLDLFWKVGQK